MKVNKSPSFGMKVIVDGKSVSKMSNKAIIKMDEVLRTSPNLFNTNDEDSIIAISKVNKTKFKLTLLPIHPSEKNNHFENISKILLKHIKKINTYLKSRYSEYKSDPCIQTIKLNELNAETLTKKCESVSKNNDLVSYEVFNVAITKALKNSRVNTSNIKEWDKPFINWV